MKTPLVPNTTDTTSPEQANINLPLEISGVTAEWVKSTEEKTPNSGINAAVNLPCPIYKKNSSSDSVSIRK